MIVIPCPPRGSHRNYHVIVGKIWELTDNIRLGVIFFRNHQKLFYFKTMVAKALCNWARWADMVMRNYEYSHRCP
jgi:hypothetical protein